MTLIPEEKKIRIQERYLKRYNETHKEINGVLYKQCSVCKEWVIVNADNFYPNKSSKEGWSPYCKTCERKRNSDWHNNNHEEYLKYQRNWQNENRKYINDCCKDWRSKNRDYKRDYEKQYYIDNPDKFKNYSKKHRNHDITTKEWNNVKTIFNNTCAYCGITEDEAKKVHNQKFHKEHVDDEGYNDLRNCVPACRSCNSQKHQEDIETWFKKQSFFTEDKLSFIIWWTTEGYKQYIEEKLPYRVIRKQNKDTKNKTFHYELWSVDEKRNFVECLATGDKKKDLNKYIEKFFNYIFNI